MITPEGLSSSQFELSNWDTLPELETQADIKYLHGLNVYMQLLQNN